MAYTAKIRGNIIVSDELSVISKAYCRIRDESGEGGSTFRPVNVKQDGKVIGSISYNGRIWSQSVAEKKASVSGGDISTLIYENRI
jgi:hypothetical protein